MSHYSVDRLYVYAGGPTAAECALHGIDRQSVRAAEAITNVSCSVDRLHDCVGAVGVEALVLRLIRIIGHAVEEMRGAPLCIQQQVRPFPSVVGGVGAVEVRHRYGTWPGTQEGLH